MRVGAIQIVALACDVMFVRRAIRRAALPDTIYMVCDGACELAFVVRVLVLVFAVMIGANANTAVRFGFLKHWACGPMAVNFGIERFMNSEVVLLAVKLLHYPTRTPNNGFCVTIGHNFNHAVRPATEWVVQQCGCMVGNAKVVGV